MATKKTKTARTLTLVNFTYPKSIMLGKDYDAHKINVELEEGLTVDKIETTWLDIQPPFETMGFYPLQITIQASNGLVATQEVEVFAYRKPHDGHKKFMIAKYKEKMYLMSYDCSNNEENKMYLLSTGKVNDINSTNGYVGQLGYVLDETTNEWVYEKTLCGYSNYALRGYFLANEFYYSNSDIYATDKKTLVYQADEMIESLPSWDLTVENRYEASFPSVMEYDETIEAHFVRQGRSGSYYTLAYCYRNLTQTPLHLKVCARTSDNPKMRTEGQENLEYMLLGVNKDGAWEKIRTWSKVVDLGYLNDNESSSADATLKHHTLMNGLQEINGIEFGVYDTNGENGYTFLKENIIAPEGRKAKYRMKNENGEYDIIHFETSMEQVQGLGAKFDEVEVALSDQYNKAETVSMFNVVDNEISDVETIANGLNERLTVAENDIITLKSDLSAEINRATTVEAELQDQINGLSQSIDAINHETTGILAQSKDYVDNKVKDLAEGLVVELDTKVEETKTEITGLIGALESSVSSNKAEAEAELSKLNDRLTVVETKTSDLEGNVAELTSKDAELSSEIEEIKHTLSNKGSDNLVFATHEDFVNANLTPKIGDLVFVIESKRAYIYNGEVTKTKGKSAIPNGWVLFDEISTDIDLADYIKRAEVQGLVDGLDAKLTAEVERATQSEQALEGKLNGLSVEVEGHKLDLVSLETLTGTHQLEIDELKETVYTQEEVERLIDEAITAQMPYLGTDEPVGKKVGHIWIQPK